METTTVVNEYSEQLQQAFSDGLTNGLLQGFEIILPYIIGAIVIVLVSTFIKAKIKNSKK